MYANYESFYVSMYVAIYIMPLKSPKGTKGPHKAPFWL